MAHLYLMNDLDIDKSRTVKELSRSYVVCIHTTMPHVRVMPRPQYVLGTISPYPTHRKVIAVSHIEFNKFAWSSSWNLRAKMTPNDTGPISSNI